MTFSLDIFLKRASISSSVRDFLYFWQWVCVGRWSFSNCAVIFSSEEKARGEREERYLLCTLAQFTKPLPFHTMPITGWSTLWSIGAADGRNWYQCCFNYVDPVLLNTMRVRNEQVHWQKKLPEIIYYIYFMVACYVLL